MKNTEENRIELPEGYHEMKSESIAGDPCYELWFKSTLICYLDGDGNLRFDGTLRTNKIVYAEHLLNIIFKYSLANSQHVYSICSERS